MAEENFKSTLKALVEKILKEVVDRRYRKRKELEHPWYYESYIGREVAEDFEEKTGLRMLSPTEFLKGLGIDIDKLRKSVILKEIKDPSILYTSTLDDISEMCDISRSELERVLPPLVEIRGIKNPVDKKLGKPILEIFEDGKTYTAGEAYLKVKEKVDVTIERLYDRLARYARMGILLTERGPGKRIYGLDWENLEERRRQTIQKWGVFNLDNELIFPPEQHLEEYALIQALGSATKKELAKIIGKKRAGKTLRYLRRNKLLKMRKEDTGRKQIPLYKFVYTPASKIKPIHLKKAVKTVIKAKSRARARRIISEDLGLDFDSYCESQNVTPWGVRSTLLSLKSKNKLTESELIEDLERRIIDPEERAEDYMRFVYDNQEVLRLLTPYSFKISLSKKEEELILST